LVAARGDQPFVLRKSSLLGALMESARTEDSSNMLVKRDAVWRYLDDDTDQGAAWREPGFDDSSWESGLAPLGFGEFGDNRGRTTLRRNLQGGLGASTTTFYFRHAFDWDVGPQGPSLLHLEVARDDGVIVYLNGEEIARSGMPPGPIAHGTFATRVASNVDEYRFFEFPGVDGTGILRPGRNVVAAEVHQANANSSDVNFELRLSRQVGFTELVGGPPGIEKAIVEAVALLPKTVAAQWSEELKFAIVESVDPTVDAPDWRTRQRVQALLGNREAALDASRKGLEALEQQGISSLPVRRELELEIVDYLRGQGQEDAADGHLKNWLDRELKRSGALRINCGGEDYEDSQGREWMADAFHEGGTLASHDSEVGGTGDDRIYRTAREFVWDSETGYRIPLPDGRYRVTLHFLDSHWSGWESGLPFDLELGGRILARNYSSTVDGPGFLIADAKSFAAMTRDGILEIALRPRLRLARLCAIEIAPIDEAEAAAIRIANVEETRWRDPEAIAEWAEAAVEAGDLPEAVGRYERAARLPKVANLQLARLQELRSGLSPDLASFASVDAVLALAGRAERDEALDAFGQLESSP
nr:hypothetical protein [Akkermansiaceae bacterium]